MSYLHCHNPNCDFCQDDFWSDTYNPLTVLKDWEKDFFKEDFHEDCGMDANWKEEIGYKRDEIVTRQELLAYEFERAAIKIRDMVYRTFEEFKEKNPEWICPKCGQKELDID